MKQQVIPHNCKN